MIESALFIFKHLPALLNGAITAIIITLFSVGLGLVIGILVAFCRIYGSKPVQKLMYLYEWVLRGLPILVILFILYFGISKFINIGSFLSVVIGLGLRSSAYQAQLYRGAILSIEKEQTEAGLSLGLSRFQTLLFVILPQAVRLSLPGFTNEFTIVLKDSPLAFAVGIIEMLAVGRGIIAISYRPFEIYLACSIIYFVLFELFYILFKKIGKRFEVPGFILK